MSKDTIRPGTLACRGTWWGPGAAGSRPDAWGRPAGPPTDSTHSSGASNLRVSDADRQATADQLKAHFAAGRLDMDEFDERLPRALGAKTRSDLNDLLRDLPPTPTVAARPARPRPALLPVFIAIAAIAGLAVTIGLAHGFFFPWWVLPIAFFVLSRHWRRRWQPHYGGAAR
jgi:Domain of unknown function (DUF1707)